MPILQSTFLWLPPSLNSSSEFEHWAKCCIEANGASMDFLEGRIPLEAMVEIHRHYGVDTDEFLINLDDELTILGI